MIRRGSLGLLHKCRGGFAYEQKFSLVNVKLKWVKDKALDAVVAGERDLRAACILVSIISSNPRRCLPVYHLSRQRKKLCLPLDLKVSTFIRRYPTLFHEFPIAGGGGGTIPWFHLTEEATKLHQEELDVLQQDEPNLIEKLRKLLMLTCDRTLPLQTIDQLGWDLGLPDDYQHYLIPRYPQFFSLVCLPDDRVGLKLLRWDSSLAISQLQRNNNSAFSRDEEQLQQGAQCLAFPIGFTRGFGLKRKCMKWLEEWQGLPYTSPYEDASHLDPRTDVSEKRIVGVFHELLHITIQKKTERKNLSNLRKPLSLPQKFTKVFGRHPGIFYISQKCATQTVILREAYDHQKLRQMHPLVEIRERYASMMKIGLLNRSRGLYKKAHHLDQEEEKHWLQGLSDYDDLSTDGPGGESKTSSECNLFSEDDLDEVIHAPC